MCVCVRIMVVTQGVGRTEPVPINIKTCRSGLGEASERKRKVEEQRAMRAVMAQKRQKHEQEWKQNVRAKVVSREMERDLSRSQKVCAQLDSEQVYMFIALILFRANSYIALKYWR